MRADDPPALTLEPELPESVALVELLGSLVWERSPPWAAPPRPDSLVPSLSLPLPQPVPIRMSVRITEQVVGRSITSALLVERRCSWQASFSFGALIAAARLRGHEETIVAIEKDRPSRLCWKAHPKCVVAVILPTIVALAGGCGAPPKDVHGQSEIAPSAVANHADSTTNPSSKKGGWVILRRETFDHLLPARSWVSDVRSREDPYDDNGVYFQRRGISAPPAYRARATFGAQDWLTVDSYSRTEKDPNLLAQIVPDPASDSNHVLLVTSPEHTDATIVRSTRLLPNQYRVSLRVGFANFGDGKPGLNGYNGGERAEPWLDRAATEENGFYWLAILDTVPGPHNNVWIHHHRKIVFDTDNNYPPWTEILSGPEFVENGEHPLMMFALDGRGKGKATTGKPFIPYSAGKWQPSGTIRAVDAYLSGEWYQVSIERQGTVFTMQVQGKFAYAGNQTYRATIDAAQACVFHFNRPNESAGDCVDGSYDPDLGSSHPHWPSGASYPDYFMFGEPHENYYEGSVHYDDVTLEVWREARQP